MPPSNSQILRRLEDHPMAGGEAYTESDGKLHPSDADTEISSVSGLKSALDSSADIIAIADDDYNLTGEQLEVGDKTMVGYRGWDGSDGALLYTNDGGRSSKWRYYRMFHSSSGHCRLTGFRMRGHDPYDSFTRGDYDDNLSNGIKIRGPNAEIDNMEMWGFPWCSVHVRGGSSRATVDVHNNHFHKNYQLGYGYAVNFWKDSEGDVYQNYFNGQRHSINGRGNADIDYHKIRDNLFGPDMNNHVVDMHCLEENSIGSRNSNPDSPDFRLRAGGMMEIENNTFLDPSVPAIGIRGYPYEGIDIVNNRFAHSSAPSSNPNTHSDRRSPWFANNMTWGSLSYPPRNSDGYPANWHEEGSTFGITDFDLANFGEASAPSDRPGSSPTRRPVQTISTRQTNRKGKAQGCERFVAALDNLSQ